MGNSNSISEHSHLLDSSTSITKYDQTTINCLVIGCSSNETIDTIINSISGSSPGLDVTYHHQMDRHECHHLAQSSKMAFVIFDINDTQSFQNAKDLALSVCYQTKTMMIGYRFDQSRLIAYHEADEACSILGIAYKEVTNPEDFSSIIPLMATSSLCI